jgi:hypothetical protein
MCESLCALRQDARHISDARLLVERRLGPLLALGVDAREAVDLLMKRSGKRILYIVNELRRLKQARSLGRRSNIQKYVFGSERNKLNIKQFGGR